jgi:CHAT domain-containing protein
MGAWSPLPGSLAEVQAIASVLERTGADRPILLTGSEATKAAFLEHAPKARWLHIATHGWFAPESVRSAADPQPEDRTWRRASFGETVLGLAPMTVCGLALAGANRGEDSHGTASGVITAEEIAGLDLAGCDLAVLSACETNVGITRAGQGIQSLQAALHAAGVGTAITSLWMVDDERARELFEDFYTRVWVRGQSKAAALWAAKMALRKKGAPTQDWAAWVLTGDPN